MSREEVKTAINELLDHTPDMILNDVLDYLKSIEDKSEQSIALTRNLRTILTEDKELFDATCQMINFEEAVKIHAVLVERFGGAQGIRDTALLDSALQRPYQTFDGVDLYNSTIEKAAAIVESVVKNHPFIDGNKRTGYVLARLTLLNDHLDIIADEEEKYKFVIQISMGEIEYNEILDWLKKNSR